MWTRPIWSWSHGTVGVGRALKAQLVPNPCPWTLPTFECPGSAETQRVLQVKTNWVCSFLWDELSLVREFCQTRVWFSFSIKSISIIFIYFLFERGWSLKKIFQKLRCVLLINSDSFLPVPHTPRAVFLHSGLRCIIKIEALKAFFGVCLFSTTFISRQIVQLRTSGWSLIKLLGSPCNSHKKGVLCLEHLE